VSTAGLIPAAFQTDTLPLNQSGYPDSLSGRGAKSS
jgi:hypothetical protein